MCFSNFKISVFGQDKRGRQVSPFFKAPYIDLIFTNNEIHFLPNKYSFFLGFSSIPTELNRRLYPYSIQKISPNEIYVTWEKDIFGDKQLIFKAHIIKDKDSIDKLYSHIKNWETE